MPQLDYFIVDVFTQTALAGNPLAVVMNTASLTTERMQAIAREFNLSETTFVERRPAAVEQREGVRVRIFTTQEELPFAGHPTLGTATVLALTAPEIVRNGTVRLALNVGPIPVHFDDLNEGNGPLFGEMQQRDPEFGAELDPAAVAPIIGLPVDDLDPDSTPQVVSTGNAFAIVLLRSQDALARVKVNHEEASSYLRACGGRWFYLLAPVRNQNGDPELRYRARMQFYGGEDPATGSAAGCAISYLVARGRVSSGERIQLRQGVEIARPSDLFLSATRDAARISDVRVGGRTVLVAKGQLFLP
ncbi:MAG TPA: PhzF family phenazine biosynthesis protein [Terracidiphilus sp.]|nr:PhzF family phenazine biosynthesis protein [Terracidiphilus sp.]